jgi:hypothetical protein
MPINYYHIFVGKREAQVEVENKVSTKPPPVKLVSPSDLTPEANALSVSLNELVNVTTAIDVSVLESVTVGLTTADVVLESPSTLTPQASTLSVNSTQYIDAFVNTKVSVSESVNVGRTAPVLTVSDPTPLEPDASDVSITASSSVSITTADYDNDFFTQDLDAVSDTCVNGTCESIQVADSEVDTNASSAEGKTLEATWSTGDYQSETDSVTWTVRVQARDGNGNILDSVEYNGSTGNRNYILSFNAPQGTEQIEVERFIQIVRRDGCEFDTDCPRYEAHLLDPVTVKEA